MGDIQEELDLAFDPAAGLAELGSIEADLDAVEAALSRLDDGSYGRCEACGVPLGDLGENPLARRCADHVEP